VQFDGAAYIDSLLLWFEMQEDGINMCDGYMGQK